MKLLLANDLKQISRGFLIAAGIMAITPTLGIAANDTTIADPGFESGGNWPSAWGSATVVASPVHSGKYAAKMISVGAENQTIVGLKPNTKYALSCWAMNQDGDSNTHLGVKNYGGGESAVPVTSKSFALCTVTFTTGPTSTSADIYVWKDGGVAASYADDFTLNSGG